MMAHEPLPHDTEGSPSHTPGTGSPPSDTSATAMPPAAPLPAPLGREEPPVSFLVARWLSIGCLVTLAVLAVAFAAFAVLIARGLLAPGP
jgi:hypothetical protein